jgi:hypothetical protein
MIKSTTVTSSLSRKESTWVDFFAFKGVNASEHEDALVGGHAAEFVFVE